MAAFFFWRYFAAIAVANSYLQSRLPLLCSSDTGIAIPHLQVVCFSYFFHLRLALHPTIWYGCGAEQSLSCSPAFGGLLFHLTGKLALGEIAERL